MTQALRWGVLSTADINEKVLAGAALSADVDVVAVASRDGGRAREFAERWRIPRAYGDYAELLADDGVDAVYIPLPNSLHHPWTLRALRAGRHVLCEKPYSARPADVVEAFEEAERRGLVLSEAFMYRYNPQITELARQVLDVGVVGDVRLIASAFSWPTPAPADIRLDQSLEGGSLLDVGVYCVSAARLLAGEPLSVTAQQVTGPSGVDVGFAGTMAFASGALAHFDSGFHLPDRSHLEVVGSRGVIAVSDPWHCQRPGLTLTLQDEEPRDLPVDAANSYQLQLEEFARAVRGEPSRLLGRADAYAQARAIEALAAAASSGTRQTLS